MSEHNARQLLRALAELDDTRTERDLLSAEIKDANAAFEESDTACADLEDEVTRQKRINDVHLKEHKRLFAENVTLKAVLEVESSLANKIAKLYEQLGSTEPCQHKSTTSYRSGMTFCDDCGVELL